MTTEAAWFKFMRFAMTHDLSCALEELVRAGRRYTSPSRAASDLPVVSLDLARAAVGLSIQIAIDVAGRDPAQMRALERELIAALQSEEVQQ